MTWVHTLADQIESLEGDLARIEGDLNRVPGNVVDWTAYWSRIDRLRRDRMILMADLRRLVKQRDRVA